MGVGHTFFFNFCLSILNFKRNKKQDKFSSTCVVIANKVADTRALEVANGVLTRAVVLTYV